MTRKDYELLAKEIAILRTDWAGTRPAVNVLDNLVRRFCTVLQDENPRFDAGRFSLACGLSESQARSMA